MPVTIIRFIMSGVPSHSTVRPDKSMPICPCRFSALGKPICRSRTILAAGYALISVAASLHPINSVQIAAAEATTAEGTPASTTQRDETSSEWPQFRGPSGDGVANANPPVQWNEDSATWFAPLSGRAWSSPILADGVLWLTNADADGRWQSLVAIDADGGAVLSDTRLFENAVVQPDYHVTNSYASPTPLATDGSIYVHFGAYGTAALDVSDPRQPQLLWQRRDLPCNHYRGPGSSVCVDDERVYLHFDGYDQQYVAALDRRSGETVWRHDREYDFGTDDGDRKKAYGTPMIIVTDGRKQLLCPAAKAIESLDPLTGKQIWFVRYDEHSTAVKPLFDGKTVYISTGFGKTQLMAIDPTGHGDVTDSHVKWSTTKGVGSKPGPILHSGKLYSVMDRGVLSCFDAATGESLWQLRLGGDFSASPLLAGNHLYMFNEQGVGIVCDVSAAEGEIIAENRLPAGCMASPLAVGNSLFVRTTQGLYRFDRR